jgi:hypothetical protein
MTAPWALNAMAVKRIGMSLIMFFTYLPVVVIQANK